jgi:molybdopterin converting factor small subunit
MSGTQIRVRYWGGIAAKLQRKTETLLFQAPPDMRALVERIIEETGPDRGEVLRQPGVLLAANGRTVGLGHRLADGDAVDILPAVAGG